MKWTKIKYKKIFDINTFKVQQKMCGYLAHQVTSLADAKKLFQLEIDGVAQFACQAGLINGRTNPYKMARLKYEIQHCLRPPQMTEEL